LKAVLWPIKKNRDLPEFHIFLNFFEKIFSFSPEIKCWKFDPGKIKFKDTIPLLLWPIILSIKLLCPTEEKTINKKLDDLDKISSETEFEALLEKIIEIFNLIKDERFQSIRNCKRNVPKCSKNFSAMWLGCVF
jgi:hypothetical protein